MDSRSGAVTTTNNTSAATAPVPTQMSIGATYGAATPVAAASGTRLAEVFWAAGDVQGDSAATNADFVRRLAYNGPFSMALPASQIAEYRALEMHPAGEMEGDFFSRNRVDWLTYNATPSIIAMSTAISEHPPLSPDYVWPKISRGRTLLV